MAVSLAVPVIANSINMNTMNRNSLDCWYEGKHPLIDISEAGFCNSIFASKLVEEIKPKIRSYLEYGDSQGSESLLLELSSKYNCSPANILITNGAAEALFLLLFGLCRPSSVVTCQFPYYSTILDSFCRRISVSLQYRNYYDSHFQFSLLSFRNDLLTKKSDVILLNSPNNPTASDLTIPDYQNIIKAVSNRQYVIFDEVTSISLSPTFLESNISKHFNKLIVIGGMSKAFGLPGIRIGWIIADNSVIKQCLAIKETMTVCTSPFMQEIAAYVLKKRDSVLPFHNEIIRNNWDILASALKVNSLPFSIVNTPTNSAYCLVKLNHTNSDYKLCTDVFQKTGVLITPGSCFSFPGYVRIGLGISCHEFTNAIDILCKYFRCP